MRPVPRSLIFPRSAGELPTVTSKPAGEISGRGFPTDSAGRDMLEPDHAIRIRSSSESGGCSAARTDHQDYELLRGQPLKPELRSQFRQVRKPRHRRSTSPVPRASCRLPRAQGWAPSHCQNQGQNLGPRLRPVRFASFSMRSSKAPSRPAAGLSARVTRRSCPGPAHNHAAGERFPSGPTTWPLILGSGSILNSIWPAPESKRHEPSLHEPAFSRQSVGEKAPPALVQMPAK